jgi:hypothetical protein
MSIKKKGVFYPQQKIAPYVKIIFQIKKKKIIVLTRTLSADFSYEK